MARVLKIGIGLLVAFPVALVAVLQSGLLAPAKEPAPIVGAPFAGEHLVREEGAMKARGQKDWRSRLFFCPGPPLATCRRAHF